MNRALWIAKKNQICCLIKKISDNNGGDDVEWLREYAKEVIEKHKDDLDKALNCFMLLGIGLNLKSNGGPKISLKTNVCNLCGYMPPFCYGKHQGQCSNGKGVLCET